MSDDVQQPPTNGNGSDSKVWGVSIRGWLAFMLVTTVCGMSVLALEVTEPLYTMASLGIGFYFGQKSVK